jgi:hypothetical protein
MKERGVPASPYIVQEAGYKSVQGESTSQVCLGVLHTVRDMYSLLTEYFSSVVLVLHAIRAVQLKSGSPRGPPSSRSWYPPR